jgi:GTPase
MLDPEKEDGNVEYKFKLIDTDEHRINELVTQMRYRMLESEASEAIYNLGVMDNGDMVGLTDSEYRKTIEVLNSVATKNNYSVTVLSETLTHDNKKVYEVLIREINENKYIDIKVCIAGNVDASKSTTLSVLTTGKLDNGRGSARMSVFNYVHELKSGRTSSISHEIMGFDYNGSIVNYQGVNKLSWNEIVQRSCKIISFFDLAGHEKYLKTTILGLASSEPNVCMIMISANNGITKMTKEHLFLCITLKIPFMFVISKIDLCKERQNVLQETIQGVNKILKFSGVRRLPIHIKDKDDVILSAKNIYSESVTPVFQISNVTGEGLDLLRMFFNIIGQKQKIDEKVDKHVEYHIDNIFNVKGVGVVLGGHLLNGTIKVNDTLLLGPNNEGNYEPVIIKSIHCKKNSAQSVSCGRYVCLAFKKIDKKIIKKGLVLISLKSEQLRTMSFTASVDVIKSHATTIRKGYEPLLCSNAIRQSVKILEIDQKKNSRNVVSDDDILRTNDSALVKLQFKYKPEYLKIGSYILLCENHLKIIGKVISIN